jgi:hypothetical protein
MGIRLLGVANDTYCHIPCRYQVDREPAIRALLNNWKAQKLDRIIVVESKEQRSAALNDTLHSILEELEIPWSAATYQKQRSEAFVRELQRKKTGGIIFPSSSLASKFCFRAPDAVAELLRTQRVALINGPVSMPFAKVPDVEVDLVTVDWQLVAQQIVDDLTNQDAFQLPGPTIFEAEAQLRVPLSAFAQSM